MTDAGKVCPGPRVKGPAGKIENNPAKSGIDPTSTPLLLFRSVTFFFAELPTRVAPNDTVLGVTTRRPA